jgi:hypothetical protein
VSETFWTLLRDQAHWEFEIFLMLLFDGIIAGVCWPFLRKHWGHHIARDHAAAAVYDWSMSPAAIAASHLKNPPDPCFSCAGSTVLLDNSVVICKECGHVTVPSK